MAALPEDVRKRVEDDLRERWGKVGLRTIAADNGISQTSVRRIAAAAGITSEGARAMTQNATEQSKARFAILREQLKERFAEAAIAALDDIDAGSVVTGIAMGEVVARRIPHTTARDRRELLTAAAIGVDKAKMLDQYDQAEDATDVAKVLRLLAGGKA